MNRKLLIVLAASALYAIAVNIRIQGLSPGHMERSLTRRIGAYGYLAHAPTYFRKFEHEEGACKACDKPYTKKQIKRQRCIARRPSCGCPERGCCRY